MNEGTKLLIYVVVTLIALPVVSVLLAKWFSLVMSVLL